MPNRMDKSDFVQESDVYQQQGLMKEYELRLR